MRERILKVKDNNGSYVRVKLSSIEYYEESRSNTGFTILHFNNGKILLIDFNTEDFDSYMIDSGYEFSNVVE